MFHDSGWGRLSRTGGDDDQEFDGCSPAANDPDSYYEPVNRVPDPNVAFNVAPRIVHRVRIITGNFSSTSVLTHDPRPDGVNYDGDED